MILLSFFYSKWRQGVVKYLSLLYQLSYSSPEGPLAGFEPATSELM
jgi:hypothetical protein